MPLSPRHPNSSAPNLAHAPLQHHSRGLHTPLGRGAHRPPGQCVAEQLRPGGSASPPPQWIGPFSAAPSSPQGPYMGEIRGPKRELGTKGGAAGSRSHTSRGPVPYTARPKESRWAGRDGQTAQLPEGPDMGARGRGSPGRGPRRARGERGPGDGEAWVWPANQ